MFYKNNIFLIIGLAVHCISLGVVSSIFFMRLDALKVVYVMFVAEWINIVISALSFFFLFVLELTNSLIGVFTQHQPKGFFLTNLVVPFLYSASSITLIYFFLRDPVTIDTGSLSSDAREAAYDSFYSFFFFIVTPIYVAVSIVLTLIQLRLNKLNEAENEEAK